MRFFVAALLRMTGSWYELFNKSLPIMIFHKTRLPSPASYLITTGKYTWCPYLKVNRVAHGLYSPTRSLARTRK